MCTKDPYMISFQIIDKVEQQVLYHANFRLDDPIILSTLQGWGLEGLTV